MDTFNHPQVEKLKSIPQFEQRSVEWFEQRNNAITASDIPTVLNENKYKKPWALLVDKCNSNPKPFVGNQATRWGTYYEDIAIEKYSLIKNKVVLSFGLLIHPEYPWLGGSPDGITTDGVLLEVKCPLHRPIIQGEIPHHYLSQILLNLEICDLEIGHFIEYAPGSSDEDYTINIVEVKRDREWFARELPNMKKFWDDVLYYRENGINTHPKFKKPKKSESPPKERKRKENTFVPFLEIESEPEPESEPEVETSFVPFLESENEEAETEN